MKPRLILASAAMHTGLVVGAAAWVAAGAPDARPSPPRLSFRPSEPAVVSWTDSEPPDAELDARRFDLRQHAEPDPTHAPEPALQPFEPPPPSDSPERRAPPMPADPTAVIRPPDPPPTAAETATEPTAEKVVEPQPDPPPQAAPPAPDAAFVEARALDGQNREPEYPRRARQLGWTGTVTVRLSIDAFGRVVDVRILEPCAHPILNRAALKAARDWSFEPARRGGVPVESAKDTSIEFRLHDR